MTQNMHALQIDESCTDTHLLYDSVRVTWLRSIVSEFSLRHMGGITTL